MAVLTAPLSNTLLSTWEGFPNLGRPSSHPPDPHPPIISCSLSGSEGGEKGSHKHLNPHICNPPSAKPAVQTGQERTFIINPPLRNKGKEDPLLGPNQMP